MFTHEHHCAALQITWKDLIHPHPWTKFTKDWPTPFVPSQQLVGSMLGLFFRPIKVLVEFSQTSFLYTLGNSHFLLGHEFWDLAATA